jgi:hypothetical protein
MRLWHILKVNKHLVWWIEPSLDGNNILMKNNIIKRRLINFKKYLCLSSLRMLFRNGENKVQDLYLLVKYMIK